MTQDVDFRDTLLPFLSVWPPSILWRKLSPRGDTRAPVLGNPGLPRAAAALCWSQLDLADISSQRRDADRARLG